MCPSALRVLQDLTACNSRHCPHMTSYRRLTQVQCIAPGCITCSEWECDEFGWVVDSGKADAKCELDGSGESGYLGCSNRLCCDYHPRCEDWICDEGYSRLEGSCYYGETDYDDRERRPISFSSALGYCSDSTCCDGESVVNGVAGAAC